MHVIKFRSLFKAGDIVVVCLIIELGYLVCATSRVMGWYLRRHACLCLDGIVFTKGFSKSNINCKKHKTTQSKCEHI